MNDTETAEGRQKELHKRVAEYEKSGNKVGIVRLIGGSVDSYGDYSPADAGEAPKQD